MKKINLRDVFPEYTLDCYIDVSDGDVDVFIASLTREIADVYIMIQREENAYKSRVYDNKSHYSLDLNDGIEAAALYLTLSPQEIYETTMDKQNLYAALATLSDKQANRIYAHYFLGQSKAEIARMEGVDEKVVRVAINRGITKLKKILKEF